MSPTVWVGVHRLSWGEEGLSGWTGRKFCVSFWPHFSWRESRFCWWQVVGSRDLERQVGESGGTALGFKERMLLGRWSREGNQ